MNTEGLIENPIAMAATSDRPKTPHFDTPPQSKTPPTVYTRRSLVQVEIGSPSTRVVSEAMEADALSKRLKEFESSSRQRDRTPGRSPSRKRQRVWGDR
jgi:hypothetical protein